MPDLHLVASRAVSFFFFFFFVLSGVQSAHRTNAVVFAKGRRARALNLNEHRLSPLPMPQWCFPSPASRASVVRRSEGALPDSLPLTRDTSCPSSDISAVFLFFSPRAKQAVWTLHNRLS